MKLIKRLSSVKKGPNIYRRRKFGCTVCEFTEVIYGDGSGDMKERPQQAIDDIKEQYKQEEENRNF